MCSQGSISKGSIVDIERPEWLHQIEVVLETLNQGVLVVDDCAHILFANSVFQELVGMSQEEILGRDPSYFYTPEEVAIIYESRERSMQVGHHRFEFVVPRKDGTRVPVIFSSRALEDPDGRQFGIISLTDISDQKRAEAELRQANRQLEAQQREIEEDLVLA